MTARRAHPDQLDLLSWQRPEPVARFEEREVRARSLAGRIARGVAVAMRECALSRDEIAARMSDYLGQPVGVPMLNAYASPSRDDHRIGAVRLIALIHVTGDRRLMELLANEFGWAVIERRYLTLIDIAAVQEREDELRQTRKALRRTARREGVL